MTMPAEVAALLRELHDLTLDHEGQTAAARHRGSARWLQPFCEATGLAFHSHDGEWAFRAHGTDELLPPEWLRSLPGAAELLAFLELPGDGRHGACVGGLLEDYAPSTFGSIALPVELTQRLTDDSRETATQALEAWAAEAPILSGQFCPHCGAGLGQYRRFGEGTCPRCDPRLALGDAVCLLRHSDEEPLGWTVQRLPTPTSPYYHLTRGHGSLVTAQPHQLQPVPDLEAVRVRAARSRTPPTGAPSGSDAE